MKNQSGSTVGHSEGNAASGRPPRVAVLGCGYWGRNLVRNFHRLGALQMVCDEAETGRTTAKSLVPDCEVVKDIWEVFNSCVQGVVIATPVETHYELCRSALEAGKDVLCEKPLALTYEHGLDLARLAEKHERILAVGHVLEYHPGIRRLLELVESNELGAIRYIYSNRLSLGKVRRHENSLWSFAPHDIAIILRLMGSMPFQVVACGGSYLQPTIADVTVTHLLFDNGVRAHIHVSWLHPFKEQRLVVIGSSKMVTFDDVAKQLVLHDQRVDLRESEPIPVKGDGVIVPFGQDEPLRLECDAFLNAISTRRPPLADGISGLRVLKVLQAAQRSMVTNGEPVSLPLEFGA